MLACGLHEKFAKRFALCCALVVLRQTLCLTTGYHYFKERCRFGCLMAKMLETAEEIALKDKKNRTISDLGDSRGPYITSQASDADASYGMAGVLRSWNDKGAALQLAIVLKVQSRNQSHG